MNSFRISSSLRVAHRPQQHRHRQLALAVDADVDAALLVDLQLHPGAARRHQVRDEHLLLGVLGLHEIGAGGTHELRDHDALGAVDHERPALGHPREIAHEHRLLTDLARLTIDEPDRDRQRPPVRQVLLTALVQRSDRVVERELPELHGEVARVVLDRRDVVDRLPQPTAVHVHQPGERLLLDVDQIRDIDRLFEPRERAPRARSIYRSHCRRLLRRGGNRFTVASAGLRDPRRDHPLRRRAPPDRRGTERRPGFQRAGRVRQRRPGEPLPAAAAGSRAKASARSPRSPATTSAAGRSRRSRSETWRCSTLHPDTDFAGDYSFVNRFSQTVTVTVRHGDAQASTTVEVFDLEQLGSLYERIVRAGRQARHRAPGAVALVQGAPVVPGAGHRRVQGRALHARAGRRHRPQAAEPRGPGLAHAGRPLPGADDRAGRDRGRPGRPRRPPHARGTGRGGPLGRPHHQRRRLARRVGAAQDRPADRAAQPAGQEEGDARVPARPPRGPQARDRARRAEPHERAGDLASRVPRRRARRAVQDAGRVPGAGDAAGGTAGVRPLAPARAPQPAARAARARARSRSSSATRTGCSRPPATSTARP